VQLAPGPVALLFGVALVVVIALAGPLLLFNPWFVGALQQRHDVPAAFDATPEAVDGVTAELLRDIYLDGPFTAAFEGEEPLLDADERSHMTDVARLVRLLAGIGIVALVLAVVSGAWLRREPARQGRVMVLAGAGVGAVALAVALLFAVAFDAAFTLFHELLFPPGTWQFPTGSNLITLFPEPFWFDAAIIAGATIVLAAVAVSLLGLWRWRASRPDAPTTLI
jgi:integral membrane protein (TIGR01906 family)